VHGANEKPIVVEQPTSGRSQTCVALRRRLLDLFESCFLVRDRYVGQFSAFDEKSPPGPQHRGALDFREYPAR
jgi:hypothetical protein